SSRIVGKAGEMDDVIHAIQGGRGKVADVRHLDLDPARVRLERALTPVEAVEKPHVVAALEQAAGEHGADVAGAARDEDGAPLLGRIRRQAVRAARLPSQDRSASVAVAVRAGHGYSRSPSPSAGRGAPAAFPP